LEHVASIIRKNALLKVFKRLRPAKKSSEKTIPAKIRLIFISGFVRFVKENNAKIMNQTVAESNILTGNIRLKGLIKPGFESVLTPDALDFIAGLQERFNATRLALLDTRKLRQQDFDAGKRPDFLESGRSQNDHQCLEFGR
jgi:hypothetical protein